MNKIENIFFKILTKHFKYNKLVYKINLKQKFQLILVFKINIYI